jgi:UDP-N-acetylglucosamine transferase subunit ALG13
MIFVTVGTHEQPFDRLVQGIDRLKEKKIIRDDIFIQTGYSAYKPGACEYKDFIRFDEMMRRMAEAEIVITHGGTGSIMLVLYHQKIPMVMPRQKKYHEHIDDHQVLFCKTMESKKKIIAVYETDELKPALKNYHQRAQQLQEQGKEEGNFQTASEKARLYAQKLNDICLQLVSKKK